MPCKRGVRESMNREREKVLAERANTTPKFHEIIQQIADSYAPLSDEEILDVIRSSPELADETTANWEDEAYWKGTVAPFIALADITGERRLIPAIRLLLEPLAKLVVRVNLIAGLGKMEGRGRPFLA